MRGLAPTARARCASPGLATLGAVVLLAGVVVAACGPGRGASPAGARGVAAPTARAPATATDHLRLAEAHHQAGRCGAAVFHYRLALQLLPKAGFRAQAEARIAECQQRGGFAPPRAPAPLGPPPWPGYPATPLTARVRIPGGAFAAGSDAAERLTASRLCQVRRQAVRLPTAGAVCAIPTAAERAPGAVSLGPFALDRAEVSWTRYQACVAAGACAAPPAGYAPPADPRRPVVGVTFADAERFCRFAKGRLPTDLQWERAGRGHGRPARIWPWGLHAVPGCARHGTPAGGPAPTGAAPVGTSLCDASPKGVLDLAGNVREWVAPAPVAPGAPAQARALDSNHRPIRGGSFRLPEWAGRVAARTLAPPGTRADDLGFRCAYVSR